MSPRSRDYLVTASGLVTGSRVKAEQDAALSRELDLASYLNSSKPLRILDLANGRLQPQYQVLRSSGHQVIGIDIANYPGHTRIDQAYRLARWLFRKHLSNYRDGKPAGGLVCGDVGQLPFCDSYFDLVTSMSAFEHFLDVHSVIAEIHRVLRTGSLAWIRIHPFTSLSGGHNLTFGEKPITHLPNSVDAWDHLRQRKIPIVVPLNEWRIEDYVEAISDRFKILKQYCAVREGEGLLIPEVEAELVRFTRDELTCCTFAIVALKQD